MELADEVGAVTPTERARLREQFEAMSARHGGELWRLVHGYERSAASREELYQEVMLQLWRALPGYHGASSLRTWMYRIAHNVAISHVAKASRSPKAAQDTRDVPLPDPGTGPHESAEKALTRRALFDAITRLAATDRQLILLHLEDLPHAEIAEITGLSAQNVATRTHRIRRSLIQRLRRNDHD